MTKVNAVSYLGGRAEFSARGSSPCGYLVVVLRESEPPAPTASETPPGRRISWRLVALGAYAAAFAITAAVMGLPAGRDWLLLWLIGALLLASVGQARGPGRLLLDFLPLALVLLAYDFLKGRTYGITGHVYTFPQIRVDEWLFGGTVPTVTLQHWFYTPGSPHLLDYLTTLTYLSYFFVPLVIAALLWKFRHDWFGRYALVLVLLAAMALITYVVFPATPPWLAGRQHDIPHVSRVIKGLAGDLHIKMGRAVGSKSTLINPIAAVPSLHFAVTSAISIFFWTRTKRWRWVLVAYPIMMGFSLVYLGEHYVADLIVGGIYAVLASFAAAAIVERWRATRPVAVAD
jgi:membrane-associated phospholipid phosphatase